MHSCPITFLGNTHISEGQNDGKNLPDVDSPAFWVPLDITEVTELAL